MEDKKRYKITSSSAMHWAKHELNAIGRIISIQDPDIQYSYAMSTLYGMLHLRNALNELINDSAYSVQREDLQRTYQEVNRAIKHLIKDFSLDVNTAQIFNTKKVLGSLNNIRPVPAPAPVPAPVPSGQMAQPASGQMAQPASAQANKRNNTRRNKPNSFFGFLGL